MYMWSLLSPGMQKHINNVYSDEELLKEIMDYKGDIINDEVYPNDYKTFFNKAVNLNFPKSVEYLLEQSTESVQVSKFIKDSFNGLINNCRFETANVYLKYSNTKTKAIYEITNVSDIYLINDKIYKCYQKKYFELTKFLIKRCNRCILHYFNSLNELKFFVEHGAYISADYRRHLEDRIINEYNVNTNAENNYDDNSDTDPEVESVHRYVKLLINTKFIERFRYIAQKLAQRRWTFIKCYVGWLGLHQRAVITANHPNRLKEIVIFKIN
jgi:hypothetical protein